MKKRIKRNCNLYIRCSPKFLETINKYADMYNISQSDVIHYIVYTIHDCEIMHTHDDFIKYLKKCLKGGLNNA